MPDMWWWKMVYLNVRYIQFTEMSGKDIRVVKCIPHKMFLGGTRAPCMNTHILQKTSNYANTNNRAHTHTHTEAEMEGEEENFMHAREYRVTRVLRTSA